MDTAQIPSVTEAVEAFIARRVERDDWAPQTLRRTGGDLRWFAALWPHLRICDVDADRMRLYLAAVSHLELASQRSRYHAVASWLQWCVAQKWLSRHPAEFLAAEDLPWRGRRARRTMGRGKPQLRNGAEVSAYRATAAQQRTAERRVAAALPLRTGLASGELRHLRVCDVDWQLGRLWVRGSEDRDDGWDVKTASRARTVGMPTELREDLRRLTNGRPASAYLLGDGTRPRAGVWLWKLVRVVCARAGVRVVCPHGLRGTWATLRHIEGEDRAVTARKAGHSDNGTTLRRHYDGAADHLPDLDLETGPSTTEP